MYLGVDAGGTKTEAVIVDRYGRAVSYGRGGAANYHNVGLEQATTSVFIAVKETFSQAGIEVGDIKASCVGIASYDTPTDKETLQKALEKERERLFGQNLTIVNDAVIGLYAGSKPPGIALISGTGSNCYGVGPDGIEAFAGNWSYLMGDQAGGYHLSLRIFRAVMRAFDGRGEKTVLRDLLLKSLNLKDEYQLVDWIYKDKPNPGKVASFGSLLDEALKMKDRVARSIFNEHIDQLTSNVRAVVTRVGLKDASFDVVLIGSFFKTVGVFAALEKKISQFSPKANLVSPQVSSAVGAAILAKENYATAG